MNDWLNKPWVIRVISFVLAVLIFIVMSFDNQKKQADDVGFDLNDLISSPQETRTLDDIEVNINIDDEKYRVSGVPQTVSVTLEGSVGVVTSTATQKNFDVFVDLEDLEPGEYTVPLQYSGISDRINVHIEPRDVEVVIEEKETKEFAVAIDYINEDLIDPEYQLDNGVVNPATIQVESAKSIVDQIAIVKAFVDVQGVDKPIENRQVPVKVYDSQGNELSVKIEPATVEVSVDVTSPNKLVPIEVETTGVASEDLVVNAMTAEPNEVRVFAAESVLADIDSISTQPIDLSTISEDTTMELSLNVPSDIRKIDNQQVTVNVDVDKLEERTLYNVPIEVENTDDNSSVTFVEPTFGEMDITVIGIDEEISNLSEDDFRLFIDATNSQGESALPIEIDGPESVSIEPEFEFVTVNIE